MQVIYCIYKHKFIILFLQCLFYIWLMAPIERNGSLVLYHCLIRPNFLRYHHKVDELISSAQDAGIFIIIKYNMYN